MQPVPPTSVQFVIGLSGYFVKDLAAVRQSISYNPLTDNPASKPPLTPGFKSVVQAGQVISILLHLPGGSIATGDCVDVIFSGAANRDPLFVAEDHIPILESLVKPWLLTCNLSSFRPNAQSLNRAWPQLQHKKLHSAVRYGLSQCLLAATAQIHSCTIAEVISHEWATTIATAPIDILASCHRGDTLQLDRMILKRAALLPHASFVHISDIGEKGCVLLEYVRFVSRRIQRMAGASAGGTDGTSGAVSECKYNPRLHFDVYGTLGDMFPQTEELAEFLETLYQVAQPYRLLIESPIVAYTKSEQIRRLSHLRRMLIQKSINVKIVADEWCNNLQDIKDFVSAEAVDYIQIKTPDLGGIDESINAVLYCKSKGIGCCLGGSANETDVSAKVTAQVALAVQPDFLLGKPGIGGDEGLMILTNEMLRAVALVKKRILSRL
ncbi:hypothetical protein ABW20_dc0110248 [Dactylellina cionopaga]|nr:hypothetical protein ABW20_dc0110248 [Dactylellina cionopaga]